MHIIQNIHERYTKGGVATRQIKLYQQYKCSPKFSLPSMSAMRFSSNSIAVGAPMVLLCLSLLPWLCFFAEAEGEGVCIFYYLRPAGSDDRQTIKHFLLQQ